MRLTTSPFLMVLRSASSPLRAALYLSFFCDLRSMAAARSFFSREVGAVLFIVNVCQVKTIGGARNERV